jgi:5'-nucleotidase
VTDVELTIDPSRRRVTGMSARQIQVAHKPDPNVQTVADHYTKAAAPLTQRPVASITADITREISPARESALGDLIADAQLAMTSAPPAGGAQIAFMNSAGIRTDLRSQDGKVTYGQVHAVHPFNNALVTLTLTGAQIHELLEEQWTGGASLQVSQGFSYEWQASAASGAKIDPGSICLHGVPIEPAKSYRVTVNEFLAGGGDGFTVLTSGTDPLRGPLDAEALEAYLRAHSPIAAPMGGRIRRK